MEAPSGIDFPEPVYEGENRCDPAAAILIDLLETVEASNKS